MRWKATADLWKGQNQNLVGHIRWSVPVLIEWPHTNSTSNWSASSLRRRFERLFVIDFKIGNFHDVEVVKEKAQKLEALFQLHLS